MNDDAARAGHGYGDGLDVGRLESHTLRQIVVVFTSVFVVVGCLIAALALAAPGAAGGCGGG